MEVTECHCLGEDKFQLVEVAECHWLEEEDEFQLAEEMLLLLAER